MSTEAEDLSGKVQDAIAAVLEEHENAVLTGYVLTAEIISGDSHDCALWVLATPGLKSWASVGMLQHALHVEQASTIRDTLNGQ